MGGLIEARRALMMADIQISNNGLLYELSTPMDFDVTSHLAISTDVALLPSDRELTVLIDFTPGEMSARGFAFFAGDHASPYYWFGIEHRRSNLGWAAGVYGQYLDLSNVAADTRCRLAMRKTAGSNEIDVQCHSARGIVSGVLNDRRITSQTPAAVGGYMPNSNTLGYIGRISAFAAYSRRLSDREIQLFF